MKNHGNSKKLEENARPHPARSTDDPITTENIGLPTDIQPDEINKLEQIKPDADKVNRVRNRCLNLV